jgi:RNA polymerase sigma-70 factor (ECF subfamily)
MLMNQDSSLRRSDESAEDDTPRLATGDLNRWLALTATGDQVAFRNLYDETSGVLFAQAIAMLRRRDAAEDALQEAYLRVWRCAATYDSGRGRALPWLKQLLRNVVIDRLRSERLSVRHCNYEDYARELPAAVNPVDDRLDLTRAMTGLSREQGSAIAAVVIEGWTNEQVGRRDGMPTATSKARVARGLKKLRSRLELEPPD